MYWEAPEDPFLVRLIANVRAMPGMLWSLTMQPMAMRDHFFWLKPLPGLTNIPSMQTFYERDESLFWQMILSYTVFAAAYTALLLWEAGPVGESWLSIAIIIALFSGGVVALLVGAAAVFGMPTVVLGLLVIPLTVVLGVPLANVLSSVLGRFDSDLILLVGAGFVVVPWCVMAGRIVSLLGVVSVGAMLTVYGLSPVGLMLVDGSTRTVDNLITVTAVLGWLSRVYLWPLEALAVQIVAWGVRRRPDRAAVYARFLPYRIHDIGLFPLPGLHALIVSIAETDPKLAREMLYEAGWSIGQRHIVAGVLIELQARALERAARERLFGRAATLDFSFMPLSQSLDGESPLRGFVIAARALDAGREEPWTRRREALDSARRVLETQFLTSEGTRRSDPLKRRLTRVARVWLDILRTESRLVDTEPREEPRIPRVFVAGQPLSPEPPGTVSLFKGRTDFRQILEGEFYTGRPGYLLLIGQRRMGKSSLRNWLPYIMGAGTEILIVDFQLLGGHPRRSAPYRWLIDVIAAHLPFAPLPPDSTNWTDMLEWLRAVDRRMGERRLLLVVDEVECLEDCIRHAICSKETLHFLRAIGGALWRIRLLLLMGQPLERLGTHWIEALGNAAMRRLSYLDGPSARDLVCSPVEGFPDIYPEGGVVKILRASNGHPYLIQRICDELCGGLNASGNRRATTEELEEVIDGVALEEELFAEHWRHFDTPSRQAMMTLASGRTCLEDDPVVQELAAQEFVVLRDGRVDIAVPLFATWIRLNQCSEY